MKEWQSLFNRLFRHQTSRGNERLQERTHNLDATGDSVNRSSANGKTKSRRIAQSASVIQTPPKRSATFRANQVNVVWSHSRCRQHPYVSRSLSAQIEAIKALFPDSDIGAASHSDLAPYTQAYPRSLSGNARQRPLSDTFVPLRRIHADCQASAIAVSPQKSDYVKNSAKLTTREQWNDVRHKSNGSLQVQHPPDRHFHSIDNVINDNTRGVGDFGSLSPESVPAPLRFRKRASANLAPRSISSSIYSFEERRSSLSRKPHMLDLRTVSEKGHQRSFSMPAVTKSPPLTPRSRRPINRSDLDKPLPPIPQEPAESFNCFDKLVGRALSPLLESPPGSDGRTSKTTVYRHWSPAVTHETVTRHVHELREERTVREIEQHQYNYRELPVHDIELLPTRHFMQVDGGGLVEISEEEVPEPLRPTQEILIEEALSLLKPVEVGDSATSQSSLESTSKRSNGGIGRSKESECDVKREESFHYYPPIWRPAIMGDEHAHSVLLHVS